jgi:TRAP-type C4-dicarboxylate transport system permease small subunit
MITRIVHSLSGWLEIIAGVALVIVMLLSGADVVGRAFGRPIPGAYEIISFAGGLVLGFAIPASAIGKVHVIVDMVIAKLPPSPRVVLRFISRLIGAGLLCAAGYALITMGSKLRATGEVTPVLQLPFYPIAYAMGFAFLVTTLILLLESVTRGGANA